MMQITDLEKEQKIPALWRLGFRPFFLAGAIFSVIAIVTWTLIYRGLITHTPLGGGYWWHIHEMIFGFGGAIIAGFLLTAVQNWTGMKGVQGNTLIALAILWLLGRIFVFMPALIGTTLTVIIDISFLPAIAIVLAKPILAIKQYRNLFFVPLLVMFTIANSEMHLALYFPEKFALNYSSYAGILLTTFLMSVMSGRVTPMFTANGTNTIKATSLAWLDKLTNGSLALAMLMLLLHPLITLHLTAFSIVLIIAGVFQCARWLRWKPWITLNVPLLWSLHGSLICVWLGLILLGLSYLIPEIPTNHVWHLLTVGGIGGIILAMISRVSLGHTGRPLIPPKSMSLAFLAIFIAALIRAWGPWAMPMNTQIFIDISALCWIIGYVLFIIHYRPMLVSNRADDRPG